jgi:hypothetical protein
MFYNPIYFIRCLILCLAGYAICIPLVPFTLLGENTKSPSAAIPKIDHILLERAAEVDRRGDQGMGFSHDMTGHHFRLLHDGGAMEVESNSPDDDTSKAAIRRHMQKIAVMFGQGDFSLPMFIHDTVPPGVEVMKRLKNQIAYTAENTTKGAQVRIATRNPKALAAIHEFLRFQIKDHRTGDPLAVQPNPSP